MRKYPRYASENEGSVLEGPINWVYIGCSTCGKPRYQEIPESPRSSLDAGSSQNFQQFLCFPAIPTGIPGIPILGFRGTL